MRRTKDIIRDITCASAKELSDFLEELNRETYQDNDWKEIAVRASYVNILEAIELEWGNVKLSYELGNLSMDVKDCRTGECYSYSILQAKMNLELAYKFLKNPPVVENPNSEGINIDVNSIDWNKPIYTSEEVGMLLGVSESTFRKWINGGWISYTQMNGSDKKFIQKEHLLAFLNNPRIFYPSSK